MIAKYLYCYTRTRNIDYRNIYGVSSSVCPQYVQDLFLRRLSALLNNTADENLSSPVYVYFRHDDIVLYGIVCLNSVLSADCCLEKTNGRGLLRSCGPTVMRLYGMIDIRLCTVTPQSTTR